jgi:hypothetical protein
MACYTLVKIKVPDTEINKRARVNLGLPVEGDLTRLDAKRVLDEAGVLTSIATVQRLSPGAIIRRVGNKLNVSVNR